MKSSPALAPVIYWHSDPVGPDETVLLQGDGFAPEARVEMAPVPNESLGNAEGFAPEDWLQLEPVQSSDQSLKAIVPENWNPGLFACRVRVGDAVSNPVFLNAPDIWWFQGDEGIGTARCGGWLRVLGKCLRVDGVPQITLTAGGKTISLSLGTCTTYSLEATLPADLAPGTYEMAVSNGCGGSVGWRPAGRLKVLAAREAEKVVLNVQHFGATAEGSEDCTLAIVQALETLTSMGGGVLYFPRGRYRIDSVLRSGMWINHPIRVPARVTLRGEGADLVTLWWPDQKEPLPTLIEAGSHFGMEDLSIHTQGRYRNVVSCQDNARIRRVRIRANCYYMLQHNGGQHHGRACEDEVKNVGTAFELEGENIQVTDCDIYHAGPAFALKHVRGGRVANNMIRANDMVFLSGGSEIIFENNTFEGVQLTAGGNNIALHFGAVRCRHVFYAYNSVSHIYGGDHEALTFDGHGTAYFGPAAEVKGTRLVLPSDPLLGMDGSVDNLKTLHDTTVYIVSGRGAGQYRPVVDFNGRTLRVDQPWLVDPEADSLIVVGAFNGRHLIIGNTASDAGATVQLYSPNVECIVAENRSLHSSGLSSMSKLGIKDHERFVRIEPSWYNQFLDNHIVWGNGWGGGETEVDRWIGGEGYLNIWGWQISFYRNQYGNDQDRLLTREALGKLLGKPADQVERLPLSRAQIVRRHRIDNNSSIRVRGTVADVIVEKCVIRDSRRGIRVDNEPQREHKAHADMLHAEAEPPNPPPGEPPPFLSPSGVLLRKNDLKNVGCPYGGTALEYVRRL